MTQKFKFNRLSRIIYLYFFLSLQSKSEPEVPAVLPPSLRGIEELSEAVAELNTVEEVMKYLEPERWQLDIEELYKPTWHVLGKSFIHNKKTRGERLLRSTTNPTKPKQSINLELNM